VAGLERLAERELAGMETIFVKGDGEVRTRSTVMAIFTLRTTPEPAAVVMAFDRATRLVKRLRQRVVAPVVPISRPYWIVDPDFDIRYHVRHLRLPEPGGRQALLDFAQQLGQVPLDPARPLWEATLVSGLDDGSAALLLKFHHAITDGQGGAQLLRTLFTDCADPELDELPPAPGVEDVTALDLTRQRLGQLPLELAGGAVDAVRGTVSAVAGGLRHPRSTVSGVVGYLQSLQRTLAPGPESSPALRRRGIRRQYLTLEVPFDDVRRAAKAVGGSVNDVYIAAVAGGLARYHAGIGVPVGDLPISMPVSIRRPEDPLDSNRFAGIRIAAPVGVADVAERVQLIGLRVRAARDERAIEAFSAVAPLASRLPMWLTESLLAGQQSQTDVQASNVPGWPEPVYLAGAEMTGSYSFAPLAGTAMMIVMATYAGRCCLAVNADAEAVVDPVLLEESLRAALAEVVDMGRETTP
jgi:diacylglycerol O-acyltransferase / wax synthase